MRDSRFIAAHRGGPLSREDHVLLARWAADVAESVLPLFAQCDDDPRPAQAISVARSWANGDIKTVVAMKASVAAHAAARQATNKAAIAAARAAGQAVATAHFADHCMGALLYGMKALKAAGMEFTTMRKEHLAAMCKWLPPNGFTGTIHHMEAKVGGNFRMSFTNQQSHAST